jgi:hypothetical protein
MSAKPLTRPVCVNLPDDITAGVDHAAAQFLQTRSSLVRMILAGWLANFDHPAAREALATLPTPTEEATHQ